MLEVCEVCGREEPCDDFNCSKLQQLIETNLQNGGVSYTPNNLPIRCIRHDGAMLEHEHGDHADYLFPVDIEYIGPKDESRYQLTDGEGNVEMMDEGWQYATDHETHALLYANCSIAVTMYETCSAAWLLNAEKRKINGDWVVTAVAGRCMGGHLWDSGEWKLTQESLDKINVYLEKKQNKV